MPASEKIDLVAPKKPKATQAECEACGAKAGMTPDGPVFLDLIWESLLCGRCWSALEDSLDSPQAINADIVKRWAQKHRKEAA